MNKTIKKLVACVSALAITSISTFSVSATSVAEQPNKGTVLSIQYIESVKRDILEVDEYTDGMKSIQTIKNFDMLVEAIKDEYPLISDYQLGRSVLMMLGDDEEFVNSLPEDKVLEALQYTAVERTEAYLRETEDGELVQISKSDYDTNKAAATTQATIPSYSETHGDIVIRSTAYKRYPTYALSGRDYYSIRGEVIWEGYPNFAMTDLLVISSSGNIDNSYDCFAHGTWGNANSGGIYRTDSAHLRSQDGGDGQFLKLSAPSMNGVGVQMPVKLTNYAPSTVNYVYSYYGVSAQNDITCQVSYAHAILAWTPSFSVNSKGAVSFGGIGIQRQTFYGTPFTLYHS